MKCGLYLAHGWGFDASFWNPMLNHISQRPTYVVDQGYFNAPHFPQLEPDIPFFAVGHSAGSLFLLKKRIPNCVGIILFNGFSRFSSAPDFPYGIAPRIIMRMQRQLSKDPKQVLKEFRRLCTTDLPIPEHINSAQLESGLTELLQQDCRTSLNNWYNCLHWITGEEDPFQATFHSFPNHGKIVKGGHLLPIEDPELCASFIHQIIQHYEQP